MVHFGIGRGGFIKNKNVLVLCGGRSAERDVSCVSAAAVLSNLPRGWKPLLVRITPEGRWTFQKDAFNFSRSKKPQDFRFSSAPAVLEGGPSPKLKTPGASHPVAVCFPVLHGPFGEDGTMQGFLESLGVPYVGSGVLASSVGMDKDVAKRLALQAGLPVLPCRVLASADQAASVRGLRFPLFVKPARLGSSVGVYKVLKAAELKTAVQKAFRFDTKVLVEQGVSAREIECAVLGSSGQAKASCLGEIRPRVDFYSYEAKYEDPNGAELIIPAPLPKAASEKIREMSLKAFDVLCLDGLARVDFFVEKGNGRVWFNEVNTLPGFTAVSMYPKLWAASGVSFPRLIDSLLSLALRRHRQSARLEITRS